MIDTVIITISKEKILSLDNNQGSFPIWIMQSNGNGYTKWIKNMPKQKDINIPYYPRLTKYITSDGGANIIEKIKIEFSVPKLIYGNNLDEVEEQDFFVVIDTLQKRLMDMGEIVERADLEYASISTVHFAKNIPISEGYTSCSVMKEIGKINIHKKLELTKVNFKDEGKALQLYATNHSIVFYDKIADLAQYKKKAIDQDQMPQQFSLVDEIKKKKLPLEILRMEVRLCKKRKIDSVMQKIGFQKNSTFKDVFKKDLCQKIIKWYWDTLIKGENLFLFELENNPKKLLKNLVRLNQKIKAKEVVYLVGLQALCREDGGIHELRSILEKRITQRTWYRITKGIKLLNDISDKKFLCGWVRQIENAINNFESFKTTLRPP